MYSPSTNFGVGCKVATYNQAMRATNTLCVQGLDNDCNGGEMDILFRAAVAGGSSEYLPEVYKELYLGMMQ